MAVWLAFKGDVLRFSMVNQGENGEKYISLRVFNFSRSIKCFKKSLNKVFPFNSPISSAHECHLESAKCLVNSTSGICQPCLILRQVPRNANDREELSVVLVEEDNSLSLLGGFSVDQAQTSHHDFHFFDGPSVCWCSETTVFYAQYDNKLEKFTLDSISLDNSMNEQGIDFILHWCGPIGGEMVAMGAKFESTFDEAPSLSRWTCINLSRSEIRDISLVPSVYLSIATCYFVRASLKDLQSFDFSTIASYDGLEIFIATNRGQLLKFVCGRLLDCWQLPFSDPTRIWILELELDEVIALVASKKRIVCAVNCKKKKVIKQWDEVDVILTDDFLENGNQQVLFLPEKHNLSESEELSNFSLIDVGRGMCSIEDNQPLSSLQSQSVRDSLQRTAKALRTRVQVKASTLHEAKLECHEKMKMVENCCKVLKDITLFQCPRDEEQTEKNPSLYCLLEGDLDKGKRNTSSCKSLESALSVKETWQRVVYNQWIIGIDVENINESAVSDLELAVVSCQPVGITYSSRGIHSNNSNTCEQSEILKSFKTVNEKKPPSTKKKKMENSYSTVCEKLFPGNLTRLATVTALPRFTQSGSCSLSVVVSWNNYCVDGSVDQHFMHCGHVTLETEQVVNGNLSLNRSIDQNSFQQDVMALKAVSIETELALQSGFSGACQMMAFVKNSLVGLPVLESETGDYKDIFGVVLSALHDNGPLSGCGIVLRDGLKNGQVTLITRNKNQVFLLLHRLRHAFPSDVKILTDPACDLSNLRDGLCTLNQEAINLQQNLHQLLIPRAGESQPGPHFGEESTNLKSKDDSLNALREGFKKKRERDVMAREEFSSQEGDLGRLWLDFVLDKMRTDIAVGNT
ncbi:Fanconi anemia group B protein-like [Montipora foliosa]|uniref:Fanconi anemia group B protein-like n=1 Tax=Montipora foliosa TaxID=591990 RepID=UPI0035F15457